MSRRAACIYRRQLETVFAAGTLTGLTDGQLLERFAAGDADGSERAFALLVERHGPMVLRVCRGVLGDPHDAEDAFQATFLVLIHRARAIRKRESMGPWLHGVALRVAARTRTGIARRRIIERRWGERQRTSERAADADHADVRRAIHDEIGRLPDRFRAPIVLCDLESRPLDEVARLLNCPLGTVKSRLNRGRERLRDRLLRRGLAPAIAGPAIVELGSSTEAAAAMPEGLLEHAVRNAMAVPSSGAAAGLAARVRTTLLWEKARWAMVVGMAVGLAAGGFLLSGGPTGTDAVGHAASTPEPVPPSAKARPRDDTRRVRITLAGQARDETGKPIAGAAIYVTNANRRRPMNEPDLLATARTGTDGRYEFKDLPLPVLKPEPGPLPSAEEGRFQVAGTARGFGFTWHPVGRIRPRPREGTGEKAAITGDDLFHEGEPVRLDLVFGPPAVFRGRIRDDRGRPLAGVPVQVGYCDDPRRPGGHGTWQCLRVDPTGGTIPVEKRSFNGIASIPEAMRSTRTAADGSFRIEVLPREAQFLTLIDPGPDYEPFGESIASTQAKVEGVRSLGHEMMLEHTFAAPVEVRFRVKHARTDQPARGVTIRAKSDRTMLRSGGVAATDEEGRAVLHLRPGQYAFAAEPAPGSLDLPAQGSIRVEAGLTAEVHDMALPLGGAVVLKALEAGTGAGIEGVGFAYQTDTDRSRKELRSRPGALDHPVTDEQGRIRAVLPPGAYRFELPKVPPGWRLWRDPRAPAGYPVRVDFLEIASGREYEVRFTFEREQPADDAVEAGGLLSVFPREVRDQWKQLTETLHAGKYRVRRYSIPGGSIPFAELETFLDSIDLGEAADPAAALRARFPDAPDAGPAVIAIVESGRLRRNTTRYGLGARTADITVHNGIETIRYDGANGQADISAAGSGVSFGVLGTNDIVYWPFISDRGTQHVAKSTYAASSPPVKVQDGLITAQIETEYETQHWVVDSTTGFVRAFSTRGKKPGIDEHAHRQYGAKGFARGALLPKVHVEMVGHGGAVDMVWLTVIDEMNPSYRPVPGDFVISAPAGTMIIDHRGDAEHPRMGTCHYPVADVLSYAEGMSSRNRPIEPVLKTGHPAPPLGPVLWLDRDGPIAAPGLTGKVVLIDFWSITCGPCVGELPEVQAAVDHFAGRTKDLVFVGLHEGGYPIEKVAEFARNRGLTYALAIDRPDSEDGWFGATFKAYGIRAIPAAAVIDRQGRIAFVGRFQEALRKAAEFLP